MIMVGRNKLAVRLVALLGQIWVPEIRSAVPYLSRAQQTCIAEEYMKTIQALSDQNALSLHPFKTKMS